MPKTWRNNRYDIFVFLAKRKTRDFTVRQISRSLDIPAPSAWSALKTLEKEGLVYADKSRRITRYSINEGSAK